MKIENCQCGKTHECSVEQIIIKKDALLEVPQLVKDYKKLLIIADEHTYQVCGRKVALSINNNFSLKVLKDNGPVLIPNQEKIDEIIACLDKDIDLILGIGSGVINDLCKIVSFNNHLPYFIIATAPSMDGFASSGSALILEGMKVTLDAAPPKVIIGDTTILKNAPIEMIQAGYGDMMGKYSCLNDWKLSHLINNEYFCQEIYHQTLTIVNEIKPLAKKLLKKDEDAIGKLMKGLVMVGVMMSYCGSSRPASGAEHHLSHYFEVTGLIEGLPYLPHGIDVLYATYYVESLREEIAKSRPVEKTIDKTVVERDIKRIYRKLSNDIINFQKETHLYDQDYSSILSKWDDIVLILNEAPKKEEIADIIQAIGLDLKEFVNVYGRRKIKEGLLYAKDLKNRYSVLWLNYLYMNLIPRWTVSSHRGMVINERMHENTIIAFKEAIKNHAEMIETDARMTKDGYLVCNHDSTVKGYDEEENNVEKEVNLVTLAELKKISLIKNQKEEVPLLEEVLDLMKENGMCINIDLKEGSLHAIEIANMVMKHGLAGRTVYATNGAIEAIPLILKIDKNAFFIDRPYNFTKEKLKDIPNYGSICYTFTSNFEKNNIDAIRESGCMLASVNLNQNNYMEGLNEQPEMTEYQHTSHPLILENQYRNGDRNG